MIHGNLGKSFQTGRPVTRDLLNRLPATLELAVYALIFGLTIGVLGGVFSAVHKDGIFDRVTRFLTVGALALPQFWVGLMLLWLFYTKLHLLPGPIGRLPVGVSPPRTITGFYVVDGLLRGAVDRRRRRGEATGPSGGDTGPGTGSPDMQDRPHLDGRSAHI